MNPIRIYLDHKDYANITKGLLGDQNHSRDVEHYKVLQGLVDAGRAECFFSAIHVVEAIRSSDDDWLKAYSKVVDALTNGRCLVFREQLVRRELAYFVATEFGKASPHTPPDLAFGRGFEAFWDQSVILETLDYLSERLQQAISEGIAEHGLNRHQRRLLAAQQNNFLSRFVIPPDAEPPDLPPPVLDILRTPGFAAQLLTATRDRKQQRVRELMDRAMTFSSLLPYYKRIDPGFGQIGTIFDEAAQRISLVIERHRRLQPLLSALGHDVDFLAVRKTGIATVAHNLATTVLDRQMGVHPDDVEHVLIEKELRGIASWEAMTLLYMEYLSKNTGQSTRNLQDSDMRDILHLAHAPYVDYLVTDRYFATTIGGRLKERFPKTTILRSIAELCDRLGRDHGF